MEKNRKSIGHVYRASKGDPLSLECRPREDHHEAYLRQILGEVQQ